MVVPVATAMVMARSYKQTVIGAIICAVAATIIGLIVSYYAEIKPGGTIVLTAVALFLLALLIKQLHKMIRSAKMKGETNESA
jgi:zinc transport system permease protein